MEHRSLSRPPAAGAGALAFSGSLWRGAALTSAALTDPASPYGPLGPPDAGGVALPEGFTARVVARSRRTVTGTAFTWHDAPDGGACFSDGTGWIYVSNAEVGAGGGGASALRFGPGGNITSAYTILSGTSRNCGGGATPWSTWLSCEETAAGHVWETSPWGGPAVRRPAMGRFNHEAAAADPVREVVYLTEDEPDGGFYRFVPDAWGDLSSGTLQVLAAGAATSGPFTWEAVPDPGGSPRAVREQVPGMKAFDGGEGCHCAGGAVWFTTKGDGRVWRVDLLGGTYALACDGGVAVPGRGPLARLDGITGSSSGDLYVAEDGGAMEIRVITPDGGVSVFLRVSGQSASELCGAAFNPAGDRMYFSSQRGTSGSPSGGITYEVRGPFRT
ncbi:alkaline phosphatase PhoX [Actinomadura sp. NEAU-AAG7]|uniref:alkaline phosphatase PhoX n=1 Tax=Actinomadura sp. NEAU-AAG7 TaxID=2839640 RepID=UPI001BE4BF21|nr:alkaline phosphatase PhoX [Actinomadura sp. NEAU-AAG7]MBT2211872.1 DUF839 domain-containing protein [Actinomadura sp. NEAU-AAG7]